MSQDAELEEFTGIIENVVYLNEETGYAVLKVRDENDELKTVVGCIPMPAPGETIISYGSWIEHPDYGRQFKSDYTSSILPDSSDKIFDFLSSGIIKGIGPATALAIVNEFGNKALAVIETSPEELSRISGITPSKAKLFSERYSKISVVKRLLELLCAYNIRPILAVRLYKFYGQDSVEIVNSNPYILATGHIGGRFEEADNFALNIGFSLDSIERIKAAVIFELKYNSSNGHCFIPRAMLAAATAKMIGISEASIEEGIDELIVSGELISETINSVTACYLPEMYLAETEIAEQLAMRCRSASVVNSNIDFRSCLYKIEAETGIKYTETQQSILKLALENKILVVSGGPGTGKSSSIKALLELFDCIGYKYLLAAPTGRAAKRIQEVTGREAFTIHRLLEARSSEDGEKVAFERNEDNKLKCDALIVDECSMIDILLMHAMLKATELDCRIILVGDADQLPPVGPGNCFKSIIESGVIKTVFLHTIFRQAENSAIVKNAHAINNGMYPDFSRNSGDFFRLKRLAPGAMVETTAELCAKRLPEKMNIPPQDIQVLSPSKKGDAGTYALNKKLQEALNPPADDKAEKKYGDFVFRTGDRVMQIRNNYDIFWHTADSTLSGMGIFNGDIGYITKVDAANENLIINFDGKIVEYGFELLSDLEHAWAITVHKSQGCEFKAVIFVLSGSSKMLLTRGVLYTGITRAKNLLILIGDDSVAIKMIDNSKQNKRFTFLKYRIKQLSCSAE